ncbi:tryptophan repeat gene family [Choristoneura biennis entomopoxvirus]|uniref:Tryptophan repeat gene family n=1 Tax=Choristoneura biennis entomopoxvirus TaxID=10288 RepID=A0A916P0S7_CBEPV|nr:tryptophan repeat gene family [Choristoneura biennis entomopoxvirus]YP_008004382.1 tryptophan repeat gene family [Choristoneura biennis entomopoxvirus]CCU55591.1 tryptophan repeat gene family [Choristoneura biennis entomopoxvirus]CCU55880.1 tryptophan repeat gene family [Choristoneura biennis entomopoxvirus]
MHKLLDISFIYIIKNKISLNGYENLNINLSNLLSKVETTDLINYYICYKYIEFKKFIYDTNINWSNISRCQKLSEDFIREFKDKVDWYNISIHQKLSEDFIREFKYKVNWCRISIYQKLSEDFIREFKNKVEWSNISISQRLSEDFIREFKYKTKVDWWHIPR